MYLLRQLDTHGVWGRQILVILIMALALVPSLGWVITSWGQSPLDAWGWLYFLLGALWWFLVLDLVQARTDVIDHAAWPFLGAFVILGVIGLTLDLRVAVAAAALGIGWASGWLLFGGVVAFLLLPSLLLSGLSLPTIGYLLERVWIQLGVLPLGALALKSVAAAVFLMFGALLLWSYRRDWIGRTSLAQSFYVVIVIVAIGGLGLALSPPAFGPPAALAEKPWVFGSWYGAEIATSPSEKRLFSESRRLSKRLYTTPDGKRVSVLIVESDDVHDLHAPEYCLSGSGWILRTPKSDSDTSPQLPLALPTSAAQALEAVRGRQRLSSLYWFSSASRSTANLAGLRLQSRLAPDEPFTLYLFTAIAQVGDSAGDPTGAKAYDSARETLAEFVRVAPWVQ